MSRGVKDSHDKTRTNPAKAGSSDAPKDYSVFVHMDGLKASASWRIASYGDDGALSEEGIQELAERFDLPRTILETMSRELGYYLDQDPEVNLVEINKQKAVDRAADGLENAARLAKRIEADIRAIRETIEPLDPYFAECEADANVLIAAQAKITQVDEAASGLYSAIEQVIKTPGSAADMSPRDKRRVWDKRRQYVVETCCYAWRDAGRALTYTTVSDGSKIGQRHGGLVVFIQSVVAKVTEPSAELSGETLRKDIDRLKADLARPDPASMPPEKH